MCARSPTNQGAILRALQKIVNREKSMVMTYFDDVVTAIGTIDNHMKKLLQAEFKSLREAEFKTRV